MKAWHFTGAKEPLTEVTLPDPSAGPGEVVIDVKAAGLCHSDVSFLDGTLTPILDHLPIVLGHEIAGVVSQVGEGVPQFAVGDRVGVPAVTYGPGVKLDGGFAEKVLVPEGLVVAVPDTVPFDQAAPATDAGRTAYRAVHTAGLVQAGQKVGIIGFGGLGSLGAQMILAAGAELYVAEISEGAQEAARKLGASEVSGDIHDFESAGLDVIIDFAGVGTSSAAAIDTIRPGGRVVQIGLAVEMATISAQKLVLKDITFIGASNGEQSECVGALDLLAEGKIKAEVLPIGFDEIPSSLERLAAGGVRGRFVALFD